jgi:hypothetical protein
LEEPEWSSRLYRRLTGDRPSRRQVPASIRLNELHDQVSAITDAVNFDAVVTNVVITHVVVTDAEKLRSESRFEFGWTIVFGQWRTSKENCLS